MDRRADTLLEEHQEVGRQDKRREEDHLDKHREVDHLDKRQEVGHLDMPQEERQEEHLDSQLEEHQEVDHRDKHLVVMDILMEDSPKQVDNRLVVDNRLKVDSLFVHTQHLMVALVRVEKLEVVLEDIHRVVLDNIRVELVKESHHHE